MFNRFKVIRMIGVVLLSSLVGSIVSYEVGALTPGDGHYETCALAYGAIGNDPFGPHAETCIYCTINDGQHGAQGSMWFNDSADDKFARDVTIDAETDIYKVDGRDYVRVYLRGDSYGCDSTGDDNSNGDPYGRIGSRISAKSVRILGSGYSGYAYDSMLRPLYEGSIREQPRAGSDEVFRGLEQGSHVWTSHTVQTTDYVAVEIDVEKFKQTASELPLFFDLVTVYNKYMYVYRCFARDGYSTYDDTACGTTRITVRMAINNSLFGAADPLLPNSQISEDCATYKTGTVVVNPGKEVCFKHWYNKNGSGKVTPGLCDWWIYHRRYGGAIGSSVADGIPVARTDTLADNCGEKFMDYADGVMKIGYGSSNTSISGQKYVIIKFKVPEDASRGQRWCQSARYRARAEKGADVNHTAETAACVEVKTDGLPDDLGVTCTINDGTFSATVTKGVTLGRTTVANLTKGDGEKWGATEAEYTIYAKPGDSIQFHHTLCPGAQAIRATETPDHSRHDPSDVGSGTDYEDGMTSGYYPIDDRCSIYATPEEDYLFERALSDCTMKGSSSQRDTYSPGPRWLDAAGKQGVDNTGGISSTTNRVNRYKCEYVKLGADIVEHVTNGYQIPGFATLEQRGNCGAIAASDVGKTISQKMNFGPTSARSELHEEEWTDTICGEWYYTECISRGTAEASNKGIHGYWVASSSGIDGSTQAQVKIPYNYKTSLESTIKTKDVVFAGGDAEAGFNVSVEERQNALVAGDEPYATITKGTIYEAVAFIVRDNVSMDDIASLGGQVEGDKAARACDYYGVGGVMQCALVHRGDSEKRYNSGGNLAGSAKETVGWFGSLAVPDIYVGAKFCVAVGIWPSDSHDAPNEVAEGLGDEDIAMKDGEGGWWNYSMPTCRTIAKKPTTQFLSGGVYSGGKVTGALTQKALGYNMGNTAVQTGNLNRGQRSTFGSFSQYELIANGAATQFASGAAFGYDQGTGGHRCIGCETETTPKIRTLPSRDGYQRYEYVHEELTGPRVITHSDETPDTVWGWSNGYISEYDVAPSICNYSTQTILNVACNANPAGVGSASNVSSSGNTIVNRLRSRYTTTEWVEPLTSNVISDLNDDDVGTVLGSGVKYIRAGVRGDGQPTVINHHINMVNQSPYGHYVEGGDGMYCFSPGNGVDNRTTVLDVKGTLLIADDLKYGTPTAVKDAQGNVIEWTCPESSYDDIASLPQLLIFADDIQIDAGVTRIDAWLIAGRGGDSGGNGTINTCYSGEKAYDDGQVGKGGVITESYGRGRIPCGDRPLVVNGPVFARRLILNRNFGAGSGYDSIDPAEVFNLRPDAYLWAYNQATRYSQAVTTYSRELAPRY